jgi:hypothetical protein
MKKIFLLLLLAIVLFGANGKGEYCSDLSVFEKKVNLLSKEASKNPQIKCRIVCDKKLYKEQKIAEAISFYKNAKEYGFVK